MLKIGFSHEMSTFVTIRDMFEDFYHYSGLKPNVNQCSIFFSGVSDEAAKSLIDIPTHSSGYPSS